jgi:hypothetical protein
MPEARQFFPILKRRLLKRLEFSNRYLKTKEVLFQALQVEYGFHSKNVNPIENKYQEFWQHLG